MTTIETRNYPSFKKVCRTRLATPAENMTATAKEFGWSPDEKQAVQEWLERHAEFLKKELEQGSLDIDADMSGHARDIAKIQKALI